jgi:transcriptional regulator with XRE-family HTH domain
MNDRIKELRKTLNLTMEKFGARLGVGKTAISKLENGERNLTDQMFKSICREFNVREEWLRNGSGKMQNPSPSDALDQLKRDYHLSEADCVMVEKFVNLRPEIRQAVFHYMKEVAASFEESGTEPDSILSVGLEPKTEHKPSIDEQVEDYRRQLELEEKAAGELPVLRKDA